MEKRELIDLLKRDVVPALGCTEPVCVALCAAEAARLAGVEILSAEIEVNPGIYKNGMSAGIPHCSQVGLNWAAALGLFLNPEKKLELLEDVTDEILAKAGALLKKNAVSVGLKAGEKGLYASCRLKTVLGETRCVIRDEHTKVVLLEKDGQPCYEKQEESKTASVSDTLEKLREMEIAQIRTLVDEATEEELSFLEQGEIMNGELAEYSRSRSVGVGLARTFRDSLGSPLFQDSLINRIILKTASAAESRLDGCPLPTMSSAGAGTKGIVVILPVYEAAMAVEAPREKRLKALALAHLVNRYINAHIGKLSPMCSCVAASSTAAAAGIAYLLGGDDRQIGWAIRNMAGTVTGMICDGGKVGCAMKVAAGSTAAVLSALTALNNAPLRSSDGICGKTAEESIRNMALVANRGMAGADETIIGIMQNKNSRAD